MALCDRSQSRINQRSKRMGLKLLDPPDGFSKTLQNFQFGRDRLAPSCTKKAWGTFATNENAT